MNKKLSKELEIDLKDINLNLKYFQIRHMVVLIQKILTENRFKDYRTVVDLQLILASFNEILNGKK